jgi:hypothetical protein
LLGQDLVQAMQVVGFRIHIHHLHINKCVGPVDPEATYEEISTIFIT